MIDTMSSVVTYANTLDITLENVPHLLNMHAGNVVETIILMIVTMRNQNVLIVFGWVMKNVTMLHLITNALR